MSIESVLNSDWPIPLWLTVLIAAGLLALVGLLYRSERGSAGRKLRVLLTVLRFSLLAMVLWMMAGWSWLRFQSDLPELVIVLDRSASMSTQDEPTTSDQSKRVLRRPAHYSPASIHRTGRTSANPISSSGSRSLRASNREA